MKKRDFSLISLLLMVLFMTACSNKGEVNTIPVDEFAVVITNPDVQLVDVRSAEEYAKGNIDGSVNISLKGENFSGEIGRQLDTERPVAVYCNGGRESAEAAEILSSMGFKVFELEKGYKNWIKENK